MASPASTVADLLHTAGLGVKGSATGWAIMVGYEPDSPHKVIVVYDTPGLAPNPKFALDFPAVQVTVRTAPDEYLDGWNKAQAVKDLLLGRDSSTIGDVRWTSVTMAGDINSLGRDDKRRPVFTLNFNLILEPPATSNRESL